MSILISILHHLFPSNICQKVWEGLICFLPLGSCVVDADAVYLFPYFFPSMMVLDVGMFSPSLSTSSSNLRFLKLAMSGLAEFILVSHLVSFQSWFPNILLIFFGLQSWMSCTLGNNMAHSGSSSSFCKVFHIFLPDRISHSLVIWPGVWSVDILRLNHVDTMILFSHDHLVFVMMFSWCVCVESPSGLIPYPHL